jgi:hypothetical protein
MLISVAFFLCLVILTLLACAVIKAQCVFPLTGKIAVVQGQNFWMRVLVDIQLCRKIGVGNMIILIAPDLPLFMSQPEVTSSVYVQILGTEYIWEKQSGKKRLLGKYGA